MQKNPADTARFKYASYTPSRFAELAALGTHGDMGMSTFSQKHRLVLILPDYPTEGLSEYQKMSLNAYGQVNPSFKTRIPQYGHALQIQIENTKFLLLFQSQIVPYLKKEASAGQPVVFYVVHATYNDFSKQHMLLVNEFFVPQ
jgi:hypothetical protein